MTYKAGDKLVVEIDEDDARELNSTFCLWRGSIREHIPAPKPEPVVFYQYKDGYGKWHTTDPGVISDYGNRKITIDLETMKATIEVLK